jgi:hypothetical protein
MHDISESTMSEQATWIAQRRDARERMRRTLDPLELWALGQIVHDLSVAIDHLFPTDHWWWHQRRLTNDHRPAARRGWAG